MFSKERNVVMKLKNIIKWFNRKSEKHIAISLGYNTHPVAQGVQLHLRSKRGNGYKTCPFDLCLTNYDGILECLEDDFRYFLDPACLKLVRSPFPPSGNHDWEQWIFNTQYKFLFNYESPNYADLHIKENWPNGATHFVENNFDHFIRRYKRRIANFRSYLYKKNTTITFIIEKETADTTSLQHVLKTKYPKVKFNILKLAVEFPQEYKIYHAFIKSFNIYDMYTRTSR